MKDPVLLTARKLAASLWTGPNEDGKDGRRFQAMPADWAALTVSTISPSV
jgi:hypothetical protein